MSFKRPLDEPCIVSHKKARLVNSELEAMKATLDNLLKSADDVHEEARIAAVDLAFELEEQLKEAEELAVLSTTQLAVAKADCDAATTYLNEYRNSDTFQMLKKAGNFDITFNTMSSKIADGLKQLHQMKDGFQDKYDCLVTDKATNDERVSQLKSRWETAEAKVVTITNFKKL